MTIAFPVLMLMVLLVIQFGLWYHANNVAEAAAQEGVRTARVEGGSAASGQDRAEAFMADNAPSLVGDRIVTVTRTPETARAEVSGSLAAIVPGFHLRVHAEAESPTERFREDDR
jgi:Flp pilus assembly protein TadG